MDQTELRRLERQCIQEEPPECTASCPLHVDVRAFIGHLAAGRWNDAGKVLRKTLPLPGILGRICDAPCRKPCKRSEVGDAIQVGLLERFCVAQPYTAPRPPPLPSKPHTVAIVGGGLSGLTAAWDLARKGYRITLFEAHDTVGATLIATYDQVLSLDIVSAEIQLLLRLGVEIQTGQAIDPGSFWDTCLKKFDAVYLGLDGVPHAVASIGEIASGSQTTAIAKLFGGGGSDASRTSPVWQAAEGRWAATSIDRFLQNVSLTAGREKEGPFATRLFTRIDGLAVQPAVWPADPRLGYTEAEARLEAMRCLQCQCLECVKVCAYLETFGGYPKTYTRSIYNNESIVMGSHQANKLINSCSLCGLCEAVCPQDFAMQTVCLDARQELVRRAKMPPSAHEFALLDLAFSQSERFALARHAPGCETSAYLFYPGCQLCASSPDHVHRVYNHLRNRLSGGVGLMLGCCAAPAQWAGRQDLFAQARHDLHRHWHDLGEPTLITACATCHQIFTQGTDPLPVVSLWEVLDSHDLPDGGVPRPNRPLAIHDPCTTRHVPKIQNALRHLLAKNHIAYQELATGRQYTECCGFGGLMACANPQVAKETLRRRAGQSDSDYLAYCAMCRDALASAGKRSVHLLDLLFPRTDHADPAERPRPGWSERQENRVRLKAHLLTTIWKEETLPMDAPHRAIRLIIAPETAALLEKRRILEEDLQKTLWNAENGGQKLVHPQTGRSLASFRPYKAFFWVEYTQGPAGYHILNAYTHRMEASVP